LMLQLLPMAPPAPVALHCTAPLYCWGRRETTI
jgi:hypothetical protein